MTFFKFSNLSLVVLFVSSLFYVGCGNKESQLEKEIGAIPVEMQVERFDEIFYASKAEELPAVKQKFPYMFPAQLTDEFWIEKKSDTIFQELNEEVEKQYKDLGALPKDLESFFKHIKYYFPEEGTKKKVITAISEVDVSVKAIYADSLALIALDTYLGKDHRFYMNFPEYLRGTFDKSQILPDLVESFVMQKMRPNTDRTFVANMVQQGKMLYAKELLLPRVDKENLIGYTKEQLAWCGENEEYMWRYFVENQLLFETDSKLSTRFIEPAPFSKFYLDIDTDSPGKVGAWLGWQIVRSYMKNNNVTLQQLFNTQGKEIFEQSKYKPRK